jgi:hypothetical protein
MATNDRAEQANIYHRENIADVLSDHDSRISQNERRWLMTKGALAMLAAVKGADFAFAQLGTLI